ncbi:tRNA-splicing endonuclease subunit Sen15 [Pseudomassariella vexata]|uniref:tRNA-splicing endonuclease subunit Sen15 n=1 Tax=Pseudomassariella vexata TaxID=1141098 RepID=A0A1Y2EE02_9PEZI|nr:tRNA-splicing endonuclease subunit Sen15 [Pseudomassariella vexata]ORY69808.1 tRNA-splicing endonuclease subunit Sen15 [Pseudomassariella vexata]
MMADQVRINELVTAVYENLENQHDWTNLETHSQSANNAALPRPMITGLPPRRLYLHPDDQIEMLKTHSINEIEETPIMEWVLPTHLNEKLTLKEFAAVFDSLDSLQPSTPARPKRMLLATIHDDSTVVYYFIHDGIVKPRQN